MAQKPPALGAVLVTGGAGFIGAPLVTALVQRRVDLGVSRVVVVDVDARRCDSRTLTQDPLVEVLTVDVSDNVAVEAVFAEMRPDTVFNLAAVIDLRPEIDGALSEAVNATAVGILISAAEKHGTRVFIQMSTMDVSWASEHHVNRPPQPPDDLRVSSSQAYVRSKARGEALALSAAEQRGRLSIVVLRPTHVYDGPDRDPIVALMRGTPPVRLGSKDAKMSMVSVASVVEATLCAAVRAEALHGQVYVLKDFDANFFAFYQEHILGRKILPAISVPAWIILASAHLADVSFRVLTAARTCTCEKRRRLARAPWPLSGLLDRDPMLCFTAEGTRQALVEFTVDDANSRRDLGSYSVVS